MVVPGGSLARSIPGVGTLLGATSVRRWVAELRTFGIKRLADGYVAEAGALKDLMKETGIREWARFWHYGRTQISLQMRLFAEQVYSDLGKPWSDLVTGFGPLKGLIIPRSKASRESEQAKFKGFKRNKFSRKRRRPPEG